MGLKFYAKNSLFCKRGLIELIRVDLKCYSKFSPENSFAAEKFDRRITAVVAARFSEIISLTSEHNLCLTVTNMLQLQS